MLSLTIRNISRKTILSKYQLPTQLRLTPNLLHHYSTTTINAPPKVIGIDLGTTNSAVAYLNPATNTPEILEDSNGNRTTPSIVAFATPTEVLIGHQAKRQSIINHKNTFYATKRLIGRKFNEEEVQKDLKMVPYEIVPIGENGDAGLKVSVSKNPMDDLVYSPSQIAGFILKEMKNIAEKALGLVNADTKKGKQVRNAVVTVPAYFNDSQRQATKTAGELVGLNVVRVVNEPTAASLSYGLGNGLDADSKKDGIVAVYDLGGGTFDISILDIEDGVFEVRATNGDTHLGGEDFDNLLINFILERFEKESGLDLKNDRVAIQRIRQAAEKAKIELSHVKETKIELPFIKDNKSISIPLTEDELDSMSLHLINQTIGPVRRALKDAELSTEDIDEVILVGGMTRMPKIRKTVQDFFGKEPNTQVNPDEAVALGAAIQGAVLSGEIKDVLLLDVTPLTLGIETYGGMFSPLIPRNTTVPCKVQQMYSTAVDGQNSIDVNVYQGERPLVKDNKSIGKFKLTDIPPMPKGTPKIEVSFDIDADGIIKVSAMDKDSGKQSSITVFGKTGMSKSEIEKLVNESKAKTKEDQMKMNYLKIVNNLELIVFDSEQAVKDWESFIVAEEKDKLINKIEIVKKMIQDSRSGDLFNAELIKAAQEELKAETLIVIQEAAERSRDLKRKKQE